jgi:hypothetical protein
VWWWRPGGGEGDSQVVYDSINDLIVGDKGEYLDPGATCRTDEAKIRVMAASLKMGTG